MRVSFLVIYVDTLQHYCVACLPYTRSDLALPVPALGVRCAQAMPVAHRPKTIPSCKRRLKPLDIEVLHSTAHGGQSSNGPPRLTWLSLSNTGREETLGRSCR